MNDIIKVGETINSKESMTSLEIAEVTGKRHADVMRDIRSILNQGVNKCNFALVDYCDIKGETRPMYQLTKKGSMILASGYNAVLREAIINRWEELEIKEREEEQQNNKFVIPQTLSEALYLAASQAKQIEEQNKQLEEQKPKVEFFNQVTDSTDAVDMKECAKILNMGIGRNRLFEFLRSRAILDRKNLPYQSFIDRGYFRTVETSYTKSDGTNCINIKTVVYQKGMDYIRKIYKESIPKH
jgi:anti-repressor protein